MSRQARQRRRRALPPAVWADPGPYLRVVLGDDFQRVERVGDVWVAVVGGQRLALGTTVDLETPTRLAQALARHGRWSLSSRGLVLPRHRFAAALRRQFTLDHETETRNHA